MKIGKLEFDLKKYLKSKVKVIIFMTIFFCIFLVAFNEFQSIAKEINEEDLPFIVIYGLITINSLMLVVSANSIFNWIERKEKLSISSLFVKNVIFCLWFITVSLIILVSSIFYVYKTFPDFQYGFIFDVINILLVAYPILFLVRKVWKAIKSKGKDLDIRRL
jgi:H+/Cl- antiporter ClcA